MSRELLIAGIDPGTTLGYALLDIDGNLVSLKSSKQLDINSLISEIVSKGLPIAIGTDRKDIPQFIGRLATKMGARVVTPDKDMPVGYKKTVTKDKKYRNEHERDALAGALYALKKMTPLIEKADNFLEKNNKKGLRPDLMNLVLREDLPLKVALEIIESPEKEETKIIQRAIDEKKFDNGFLGLYDKLKRSKRECLLLKEHNEKLKAQLRNAEQRMAHIQGRVEQISPDKKAQERLQFKEHTIQTMVRELEVKSSQIGHLTEELNKLNEFLSEMNENVLIKKIKNLGTAEFESKILKIKKGDILLVDDLSIVSNKTIDFIKNKVDLILYRHNLNDKLREGFFLVNANKFDLKENEPFALAPKRQIEREKLGRERLAKIIEDYRKRKI